MQAGAPSNPTTLAGGEDSSCYALQTTFRGWVLGLSFKELGKLLLVSGHCHPNKQLKIGLHQLIGKHCIVLANALQCTICIKDTQTHIKIHITTRRMLLLR